MDPVRGAHRKDDEVGGGRGGTMDFVAATPFAQQFHSKVAPNHHQPMSAYSIVSRVDISSRGTQHGAICFVCVT